MLVIISGRSGSGKSVALHSLEDMGFYCVDNIPAVLLPDLLNVLTEKNISAAISIDIRNLPETPQHLENMLATLSSTINPTLVFLDADRQVLIRRYSDSRRLHPLSASGLSLEEAIDKENDYLLPLRQHTNLFIDTTHMSVHELAEVMREKLLNNKKRALAIIIKSFGYKQGLPLDADYVFDARFLPNPHWVPELRPYSGLDQPVIQFLSSRTEVSNFIHQTYHYIEQWMPYLEENNRSYLTIAIGCTGGQHRSVYIAEQLTGYFYSRGKNVQVKHRDISKKTP